MRALRACGGSTGGMPTPWRRLKVPKSGLRLDFTLPTGQTFRWRKSSDGVYTGVVGRRVIQMKEDEEDVWYRTVARGPGAQATADLSALREYFNLDTCLTTLTEEWAERDARFRAIIPFFPGARVLRQDPLECLFEFICSSNNHISRIQGMVERLCEGYGLQLVPHSDNPRELPEKHPTKRLRTGNNASDAIGNDSNSFGTFYAFPTVDQLLTASEDDLRKNGFGYRAKFITGAATALSKKPGGGSQWLHSLRQVSYEEASEQLCTLPGVGPKVAACICLFSLDKHEAIPVDTHVWQIATRYYTPELKGKSLTKRVSQAVEAAFTERFGAYAGWAHNVLFISELASHVHYLPESLRPRQATQKKSRRKAVSE